MPPVSVLLPVRNAVRFLPRAVASLERQSFSDFEIVVVDDGSDDGSERVLECWQRRDPRVRLLRQEPRGLVAALQHGLAACSGVLVARMDADDVVHPRRLERQLALLRNDSNLALVSCLVRLVPRHSLRRGMLEYERWLNSVRDPADTMAQRFVESPVAHPSVLFRREVVEDAGGYRDVGWPEDYDLWLRMLERGARFAKVPERLLFWRDHGDRASRVEQRYSRDRFAACRAWHLANGPLGAAEAVLIWGAGQTGRRLVRHLAVHGVTVEGFLDVDPNRVGGTVCGYPVWPVEALGPPGGPVRPLLAAVPSWGVRDRIRAHLRERGWREAHDFWCVA